MKERLPYLDGMKGIACFLVFVHHFLLAFYIAFFTGRQEESHFQSGLDMKLAQSPVSVIVNGQFWVCVFVLISAFLAALHVYRAKSIEQVAGSVWKRYFRLALPMLVIGIITWAMHKKGMFINMSMSQVTGSWWLDDYFYTSLSFGKMLYVVFYAAWIGDINSSILVSHAFWMMSYLLIGFYIAILLAMVVRTLSKKSYWLLGFAAVIIFFAGQYYYLTVIAGVLLADIYEKRKNNKQFGSKRLHHLAGAAALLAGLYLGGYPSGVIPTNLYAKLPFLQVPNICIFYHAAASILVCSVLLLWKPFQVVCSVQPLCRLGKLCYGIFLVQTPVEFCLSLYVVKVLLEKGMSYHISVGISFVISTIVLLISAWLFHVLVEKNCDKLLRKAEDYMLKNNNRQIT